ncbi:hypothetical protein [Myceligenerans crystallogenes]|uniref:NfeD-like C-terminal domain-containing protein n=1 Tax=Myceligenerans crystallogenes TaxID=316335 RepID=A0ABN2NJJ6_9MICO
MPDGSINAGVALAGAIGVIVIGIGVIAVMTTMLRRLREDDALPRTVEGVQGIVASGIAPAHESRPHGEVSLDGELETRIAVADSAIARGTRIVVVEQHGGRVKVAPHPLTNPATPPQTKE